MSWVTWSSSLSLAGRCSSFSLPPLFVTVVYEPTSSPMPDESIVVTPERSRRILLLEAPAITSRSCWSPAPIVILPSTLMIAMSFTSRVVAFISLLLCLLPRGRPRTRKISGFAAGDTASFGQIFGHDQRSSAAGVERIADLVHERAHVEDAAAARLHQILRVERIADLLRIEAGALIGDGDGQLVAVQFERGIDLLLHVQLVAVLDGVRHGLADGHADPMRAVFIHPGVFAEMFVDHLHELDVLEPTADGDLDPLAVTFHQF